MKLLKKEMLELSTEALEDIELSRLPLVQICLKALRLARLAGDEKYEKAFRYEISGYGTGALTLEMCEIARFAKRGFINESGEERFLTSPLDQIPTNISDAKNKMKSILKTKENLISNFSYVNNSNPMVVAGQTNKKDKEIDRLNLHEEIIGKNIRLNQNLYSNRLSLIHEYLLNKNIELKFEDGLDSILDNMIERVSEKIAKHLPDGAKK